jgi:thiosulfate reductase cytochrome b subunit
MMTREETEKQAFQRFMMLNIIRFVAVFLVMFGLMIITGKLLVGMEFLGYILVIMGMFEFFALPIIVKKMWKKQDANKN